MQKRRIKKLKRAALVVLAAIGLIANVSVAQPNQSSKSKKQIMETNSVHYLNIKANGLNIFYREAGPKDAPVVLLLHGYPTSSHMFRNLIPILSKQYHVIAPDLPGYGYSDAPDHTQFAYTFDNMAKTMQSFIDELGLKRFALYVFDYGAPTGYRLALANPEKITGIISQNGNAYEEGLSTGWAGMQKYWADDSKENRDALREFVLEKMTKFQYFHGVEDSTLVAPESYTLDQHFLDRPGNVEIQLDLMLDYRSNVALYPKFQAYFRDRKPPILAVWGNKDPFFLPAGAEGYKKDDPNATVKFYDTGHFALETHVNEIGQDILKFLEKLPR
jgi:pimeloyl-ACP methyl ester carboxylesterase